MKELDPVALFRLSVLGPLVSRQQLSRGELKALLCELTAKDYDIPGSRRRHIAQKTLQQWLYNYRRDGLAGLTPKQRCDQGLSKLSVSVQERLASGEAGQSTSFDPRAAPDVGTRRRGGARYAVTLGDSPLAATPRSVAPGGCGE